MKKELKRRLTYLQHVLNEAIEQNTTLKGLLPALYSVYTYLWCKGIDEFELTANKKEKRNDYRNRKNTTNNRR